MILISYKSSVIGHTWVY